MARVRPSPNLSPAQIRRLIEKDLPAWLEACASDADTILMHQRSFGTTADELMLLGCALKYAAQRHKDVHVTWHLNEKKPRLAGRRVAIDATYREANHSRLPTGRIARRRFSP
jgi:hypothetical protein